jgi:chromosomal replication initiation ATPase DnaA
MSKQFEVPCDRSFAWAIPGLRENKIRRIYVSVEIVLGIVCRHLNITRDQLLTRPIRNARRAYGGKELTGKRAVAQYIIYHHCKISYSDLARMFGLSDHTTTLRTIKMVQGQVDFKHDNFYRQAVLEIMNEL